MNEEEFICISYYDTKKLPIDIHCTKYRNIKYDIQEVLERTDDIDYVISDSRTTKNLLKENKQLKSQLQQKENIINELEKWLEEQVSKSDLKGCSFEKTYITGKWNAYKKSLNKLQELKGDSNE